MNDTTTPDTLSDDPAENLDRFVVEALESGCVWGLQNTEGWAICSSENHDNMDVIPFWSRESFALIHCNDDWKDYAPVAIELGEFLEDWLPGMHEDVVLVGVNWDSELEGDEIEPLDLLEEFDGEITE